MNIFCSFGAHHTVEYARDELEKYLLLIDENNALNIDVGVYSDFDMSTDGFTVLDDEICISIKNNEGIIAGCNERSVLIAVYRFLTELGCVFLRPGKDGEYIPHKSLDNVSLEIKERPSYRHRGICIEGANSNENILDIIEWMPKVGMNAYYIQFREAYTFYEQWYSHTNNPLIAGEKISLDDARVFCRNAIEAMKKRSLVFHGVGHGWTCEPLGVNGIGWYDHEEPTPEQEKYIALVNGKRAWWGKKPLNTNLCYSNPEVRELIIGDIVNYIKGHRDVDVLHFWLGDGANNNCECDGCKDTRPSDYYVMMLNELDKRLDSEGIDTKIVFLIYVDLLWAPEIQRLNNKDRFILMFAPITRSYSQSYEIPQSLPEIKPYVRNKLQMPKSVGDNVAMLKSWQNQFDGDSFDYDYHLLWDHYNDPGYWKLARILGEDVKNLYKLGLNGLVSCQVQRVFYPTGLPMQIMARALWNKECDLDFEIERFMRASFGEEYKVAENFLKAMSDLCEPEYVRRDKIADEGVVKNLSKAGEFALSAKSDIIRCMDSCTDSAQRLSWEMLYHHTEYCKRFAELYCEKAKGSSKDVINEKKEALLDYANSFELNERLQPYFDTFVLDVVLKRNTTNAELFG